MEIWKDIPGFDKFQASNLGNIRSKKFKKIRKSSLSNKGYLRIKIPDNKNHFTGRKVHRLVALAFFGDLGIKQVDHINRIRTDNRIENLRMVTAKENNANRGKFNLLDIKKIIEMSKKGKSVEEILISFV